MKSSRKPLFILVSAALVVAMAFLAFRLAGGRRAHPVPATVPDFSGQYSLKLLRTRSITFPADSLFVPDIPIWSNALVVISQPSPTNLVCVCLSERGETVTNSIVVDGRHWWWDCGRLVFSGSAIYPGMGIGFAFPQIMKTRKECEIEPIRKPTPTDGAQTLRVTFRCQVSGFLLFPPGPWHDPEEESEVLLVPQ